MADEDEEILLAAIRGDPGSTAARLALADHFEDSGDHFRAGFIRSEIEDRPSWIDAGPAADAFFAWFPDTPRNLYEELVWLDDDTIRFAFNIGELGRQYYRSWITFRRGLPWRFGGRWPSWYAMADELCRYPIDKVELSTLPEVVELHGRRWSERPGEPPNFGGVRGVWAGTSVRAEEWPQDAPVLERILRAEWPGVRKWSLHGGGLPDDITDSVPIRRTPP